MINSEMPSKLGLGYSRWVCILNNNYRKLRFIEKMKSIKKALPPRKKSLTRHCEPLYDENIKYFEGRDKNLIKQVWKMWKL